MEAEMKMVFQQKVQEKEAKLKQSEEELYARHKEMKDALEKQRSDLEDKKRKIESGRPVTPDKSSVCVSFYFCKLYPSNNFFVLDYKKEGFPSHVKQHYLWSEGDFKELIVDVDTLHRRWPCPSPLTLYLLT